MPVTHTPSEWMTRVRHRTREALAENKISAAELGRRIGRKQQYMSRRLKARDPIPFSGADIEAIARALDIPLSTFFADQEATPV